MTVRPRSLIRGMLATAAGLCLSPSLLAQEPPRLNVVPTPTLTLERELSPNQRMANLVADHLRQSGQLHRYAVNIAYADGKVELTGSVGNQMQREEVLRLVQGVPGVERVVDHLSLAGSIVPVEGSAPPPTLREPTPVAPRGEGNLAGPGEPMPIFSAPPPTAYDVNSPKMPPYAWPTYAPYNNYSRVAYPLAYPYSSFPYIGPNYPFPKIPLGWRSVKLRWEDGHWWFGQTSCQHDWWRLRYW